MYLLEGVGQGTSVAQACPLDPTGANDEQLDQRIRAAVDCELRLRFATPTDPGLHRRRLRLRSLFKLFPTTRANALRRELEENQTALAQSFWGRLHSATSKEMLAILAHTFFQQYELRFNPSDDPFSVKNNTDMDAQEQQARIDDIDLLIGDLANAPGILWQRALARKSAALAGNILSSVGPLPALTKAAVERLSSAQLELFRESFPQGTSGIDFVSFQRVFERFANGELRDPSVYPAFAEPNGGAFFLFAEFAFICVERGIEADPWKQALRTFVKTQEVFMHVYRERPPLTPPPVGATLPTGGTVRELATITPSGVGFVSSNFTPIGNAVTLGNGQSSLERKRALRAKYDTMELPALQQAARDNIIRALRTR
jgi:hypothetical protein